MKAIIRNDDQAVSPVIATILMVAITVVLAAVLYVMVSGLIGGTTTSSKPAVTMTVTKLTAGADVLIAGIQPTAGASNFKVNVENVSSTTFGSAVAAPTSAGGVVGTCSPATSCATVIVGAAGPSQTTFVIVWQNPGGSGQVSQGDHFVIKQTAGAYKSGTTFAFLLIWSDGSTLTSINWQV